MEPTSLCPGWLFLTPFPMNFMDVPLASEEVPGIIESDGERRPVPDIVPDVLTGAPDTYQEHDSLTVDATDVLPRNPSGKILKHLLRADLTH